MARLPQLHKLAQKTVIGLAASAPLIHPGLGSTTK
jgi:hypothetical protein